MKLSENTTFVCECGADAVVVTIWPGDVDEPVGFCILDSRQGRPDWLYRLKLVWQILTTGSPYTDDLLLSRENIGRLISTLRRALRLSSPEKTDSDFDFRVRIHDGFCEWQFNLSGGSGEYSIQDLIDFLITRTGARLTDERLLQ